MSHRRGLSHIKSEGSGVQGSGRLAEVSLKPQEERPDLVRGLPFLHAEWP